jgi:FkbM family methyltransferase
MPSQFGQDQLVLELLRGKRGGFFVEVGAGDGVSHSNTHVLEQSFGWIGICIEPNRWLYHALIRNRHCRCLNCCLYHREGKVEFLEMKNLVSGILDEYDPRHLRRIRAAFPVPEDEEGRPSTVRKRARTMRSVLRECKAPRVIDYWSLDVEGSELAILKSFPFDEYQVRMLTVEHNRLPVRHQIRKFLEAHGYERIRVLSVDDCYLKRDVRPARERTV